MGSMLPFLPVQSGRQRPEPRPQFSHLNQAQPQGKIYPHGQQRIQQDMIPEPLAYCPQHGCRVHTDPLLSAFPCMDQFSSFQPDLSTGTGTMVEKDAAREIPAPHRT